ncbi:MAG: hypothetical protein H6Q13_1948 [Bacteroidetes bacterium]|jgi:hypothetical protein|nr:hypothetical protein [Bacteroidota bacterium]
MRLKFIACKYTVFIQVYDLNRLVFLLQAIKKEETDHSQWHRISPCLLANRRLLQFIISLVCHFREEFNPH